MSTDETSIVRDEARSLRAHALPTLHRHAVSAMGRRAPLATHLKGPHASVGALPRRRAVSGAHLDGKEVKSMTTHMPQGPDGAWKTGQRVPFDGDWADQYGIVTRHERGATFPPCIDRKGECAYRYLVEAVAAA